MKYDSAANITKSHIQGRERLTDSLIDREVTLQSSEAHQYDFLIQMNETHLS